MKKVEDFEGQKMIVLPNSIINLLRTNAFTRTLYLTDIGYFPLARYHSVYRESGSLNNILIYCVDGKGWIKCNGIRNKIQKNQYYIITENSPHSYGADPVDPWTIYWIHFNGENAGQFINPGGYPAHIPETLNSRYEERINLFDEMLLILEDKFSNANLEYSSVLLTHFLGTLKYLVEFENTGKLKRNSTVSNAVHYMKDNLKNNISLREISDFCGLSVSHFCLQFKRETSYSPIDYFSMIRIQKSCKLLCFTNKKVKEIASDVGYDDPYYFTRVFKKKMGESPLEYRKSNGM